MATSPSKRQMPSKPGANKPVAMEVSTSQEDAKRAQDQDAAMQAPERSKEDEAEGKKKVKFEILTDGAIFDGKKHKLGDTITMTNDEAHSHQKHGVGLVECREKK